MPKYFEGLLQVFYIVDFLDTPSDHVVYVHLHCLSYDCHKVFVDDSLVGGSNISQAKQYYIALLQVNVDKKIIFMVFLVERDLVIPERHP